MRILITLLISSLAPALAYAGVDYKCDSVKYEDQISGWLRFGSHATDGSVYMEYWNGYPPITLVDAAIASSKPNADGGTEIVSEPDHHSDDTVATVELPSGYASHDKFVAKIDMRYISPENRRLRVMKYELNCVRH